MSDDKINLSWNSFQVNATTLSDICEMTSTCLMLLTVDDNQINAYKVILSSCSPLSRNILMRNPHQNPLLYMKDIQLYDLHLLLKYIYHGECNVSNEKLDNFLIIGEQLKINRFGFLSDKDLLPSEHKEEHKENKDLLESEDMEEHNKNPWCHIHFMISYIFKIIYLISVISYFHLYQEHQPQ